MPARTIRTVCANILPIDVATHAAALRLAERHGFAFFDALMLASALEAGSDTLWSEDMQHGMTIDGRLRIPYRRGASRATRVQPSPPTES